MIHVSCSETAASSGCGVESEIIQLRLPDFFSLLLPESKMLLSHLDTTAVWTRTTKRQVAKRGEVGRM